MDQNKYLDRSYHIDGIYEHLTLMTQRG